MQHHNFNSVAITESTNGIFSRVVVVVPAYLWLARLVYFLMSFQKTPIDEVATDMVVPPFVKRFIGSLQCALRRDW